MDPRGTVIALGLVDHDCCRAVVTGPARDHTWWIVVVYRLGSDHGTGGGEHLLDPTMADVEVAVAMHSGGAGNDAAVGTSRRKAWGG